MYYINRMLVARDNPPSLCSDRIATLGLSFKHSCLLNQGSLFGETFFDGCNIHGSGLALRFLTIRPEVWLSAGKKHDD